MNEQNKMVVKFEDIKLTVHPSKEHEWLLETSLVAKGYETEIIRIQQAMIRRKEDLIEGKHYIRGYTIDSTLPKNAQPKQIFWTKHGVVRLGFFLRCEKAKMFRDWAEDLIIYGNSKKEQSIDEKTQMLLGQEGYVFNDEKESGNIKLYSTISHFLEKRGIHLRPDIILDISSLAKDLSVSERCPVMYMPSQRFGKINMYHESVIRAAYYQLSDEWLS